MENSKSDIGKNPDFVVILDNFREELKRMEDYSTKIFEKVNCFKKSLPMEKKRRVLSEISFSV